MPSEISVQGSGATRGTFLTAVERIKAEIHRGSASTSDDFIKRALITAMEYYRWHRFWFNEGTWNLVTTDDLVEYGMETTRGAGDGIPLDMLEIDEMYVFEDPVGSASTSTPRTTKMKRHSIDDMRVLADSSTGGTRPYFYGWHHETLMVYPAPNDEYRIRIDGLKDLDVPRYQSVGGGWIYGDQDGAPLGDDYVSQWLVYAEELIRSRAKADLYANVFFEDARAATARGEEKDAYDNLARATHKRVSVGHVRPHFGGRMWL